MFPLHDFALLMSDLKSSVFMSGLEEGVTRAVIARLCRSVGKVVKSALVLDAEEKWTLLM